MTSLPVDILLGNDALWHHHWLANDALWHHYWLITLANDVMSLLKKGLNSLMSCWWCWMTQISSISTWFPLKHHKLALTFHKTKACMLISLIINLLTKSEWNLCGHRKSLPCKQGNDCSYHGYKRASWYSSQMRNSDIMSTVATIMHLSWKKPRLACPHYGLLTVSCLNIPISAHSN